MKKKCLNYLALLLLIVSLSNCKTSVNTKEELIKVHSIAYEQRLSEYVYFINNSFYFLNSHDLYKLTYAGEQLKLFEDVKSIEFIDGCLFVDEEYLVVCDDEGLYPKDLTDLYLDEVPFSFGDYATNRYDETILGRKDRVMFFSENGITYNHAPSGCCSVVYFKNPNLLFDNSISAGSSFVECPPRIAPVSKLVNSRYTDFERSKETWQGRVTQRSRSSSFFVRSRCSAVRARP